MRTAGRALFFMWVAILLFNIAAWAGGLWVTSSVVVSGFKALRDNCGSTYEVEEMVSLAGNLFCTSEK